MNIKIGILNVPKHGNKHDLIHFVTCLLAVHRILYHIYYTSRYNIRLLRLNWTRGPFHRSIQASTTPFAHIVHVFSAMYQTEMTPELDKVNKMITKSHSVSQSSSQSDLQTLETRTLDVTVIQALENVVMATTHADELPHPSEVLIDLKDSVKILVIGEERTV